MNVLRLFAFPVLLAIGISGWSESLGMCRGILKESDVVFIEWTFDEGPFARIDRHASSAPRSVERNIEDLGDYLAEEAETDLEKARAIYTWITQRIRYNDRGFNTGRFGDNSAQAVLKRKRAVCDGFSNLYLELGEHMGLEIEKVVGFAKGYGHRSGKRFRGTNHAWNIILIDGEWRVFDATWGEGYAETIRGRLVSRKRFNGYWFNVDPYEAIFTHFPQEREFAHTSPLIDLRTFEALPYADEHYFKLGFDGRSTFLRFHEDRAIALPVSYAIDIPVHVRTAPADRVLQKGQAYTFELYAPDASKVVIIEGNDEWSYFYEENGLFSLKHTPKHAKDLKVSVQYKEGGKVFWSVLKYEVKRAKGKVSVRG